MANKKTKVDEVEKVKYVRVVLWVVCIFLGVYVLTGLFVTKDINFFNNKIEEQEEEVNIQYEEIVVGEILTRPENDYYVFLYDFDKDNYGIMAGLVATADIKAYSVNMNHVVNRSYFGETPNLFIKESKNLIINENTLLKIEDGTVVNAVKETKNIIEYFNN